MRKSKTTHRTPKWDQPGQVVTLDLGAGHEPVGIVLPAGFDDMTATERHAWGRREIHTTIDDLLRELLP
jgi:hypothetical protein